jgi:N-acetylglucosaminyldiphosphoundecaprenol N-acetyl-beta-D-mannosaminyltransferase
MRYDILGVGFDNLSPEQAAERAMELMERGGKGYVVTPNPEIVNICRKDPEARRAVNDAFMVLPDGIGIVYASKLLGYPIRRRSPGIEFASLLMDKFSKGGKKLFLLGAKPDVAEEAAEKLRESHPGLEVCGTQDGYFKDDGPVVEKINQSGADAVFVCLGAPKQELWMAENARFLNASLLAGLGGSLDVFAGRVRRAPLIWRKLNLEWLYRIMHMRGRGLRIFRLPAFLFAAAISAVKRGFMKHD